jgi:hypothetical protein
VIMRLFAVVALVAFAFSPSAADQQKSQSTEQNPATQNTPSQPSPVTIIVNQPSAQSGKDSSTEKPRNGPPIYSNWALVIVAGFAAIAGLRSLYFIKKQAEETEKAANAARDSALAVVNAERAWVMADLDFRLGSGLTHVTSGGIERTAAMVELRVQNCGPTPAWIFEQFVCLRVANFVVMSKTEYPSPQFPDVGDGKVLHANYSILPMVEGQEPARWVADVYDEGWATEDNGLHVHIFGVVRYRDAFSLLRETYFGYSVWKGQLERMPSEAYNRHT